MSTVEDIGRELDCREFDGIEVRLLWREHDERCLVSVIDSKTDDSFVIEVPEDIRPYDVFWHPYAFRG